MLKHFFSWKLAAPAVLAIVTSALILLHSCGGGQRAVDDGSRVALTTGEAMSDDAPEERQDVVDELNALAKQGMLTMAINTEPVFASGTAKGNLLIENDPANRCAQVVQIFREDTGELIYTSGVIPVGKYLNEDALDVALPAGDYPCTACFYAVGEDGAVLGSGAVKVTLHVKS